MRCERMSGPVSILQELPGGAALFAWSGRVPRFHDGELLEIAFFGKGQGRMRIHGWTMTDKVDAHGYFITEKHAVKLTGTAGLDIDIPHHTACFAWAGACWWK